VSAPRPIETQGPGGCRRIETEEFPLAIGGPDSDLRLPGIHGSGPLLYLGLEDGEIFAQPADPAPEDGEPVLCNGLQLATSHWLQDGDVIGIGPARIEISEHHDRILLTVVEPSRTTATEPPQLSSSPASGLRPESRPVISAADFRPRSPTRARRLRLRVRPMVLVQLVIGTILAAGLWFVFTARSVAIEIEPSPERVALRGGLPAFRIGDSFLVRPGRYRLEADREGFRPLQTEVEIGRRKGQVLRYSLERLPGTLTVTGAGAAGAEVVVDGRSAGLIPIEGIELAAGDHRVEVRAEGYRDFSTTVHVEGPGTVASLDVELEPDTAPVSFATTPPGAAVEVDGELVGRTPVTVDVLSGGHAYAIRLDGYKARSGRIDVEAGRPLAVAAVVLRPVDGTLAVTSDPGDAMVAIDGDYAGRTPLDLELTPEVPHSLQVSKNGYSSVQEQVQVAAGTRSAMNVTLEPQLGEVEIVSNPPVAELSIDGRAQGSTGRTLELIAVPHEIEIRKEGYEIFRTSITPRPGIRQTIRASLKAVGEPAQLPASITSPQGVELRLIPAGRFTMGASRREPGRRANESLHEVQLTHPFYMAAREVSNREFREFQHGHRSGAAGSQSLEIDDYPVVRVTWQDAARYCNWLSEKQGLPPVYVERGGSLSARSPMPIGYRLPTEAEWAWAARFPDGRTALKYAWGEELPIPSGADNYGDHSAEELLGGSVPGYDDSYPATAPVGSFAANPRGLFNLGGNVSEWVHDVYTIYPSGSAKLDVDPTGPAEGEYHVIRGASWMDDSVTELRLSYRDYGNEPRPDVGFRIARSVVAAK